MGNTKGEIMARHCNTAAMKEEDAIHEHLRQWRFYGIHRHFPASSDLFIICHHMCNYHDVWWRNHHHHGEYQASVITPDSTSSSRAFSLLVGMSPGSNNHFK
jgi:hypothetical protein